MKIEKLLRENKINYTVKREQNTYIYNIDDEKMLIVMVSKSNVFSIGRELFNKIDEELLPYSFCLIDSSKNQIYFIKINEPNNFLRDSFDYTEKDILYFGKQVLNNKIEESDIINKIKEIGM